MERSGVLLPLLALFSLSLFHLLFVVRLAISSSENALAAAARLHLLLLLLPPLLLLLLLLLLKQIGQAGRGASDLGVVGNHILRRIDAFVQATGTSGLARVAQTERGSFCGGDA